MCFRNVPTWSNTQLAVRVMFVSCSCHVRVVIRASALAHHIVRHKPGQLIGLVSIAYPYGNMPHGNIRFQFGKDAFLRTAPLMVTCHGADCHFLVGNDHLVIVFPAARFEEVQLQFSFALLGEFLSNDQESMSTRPAIGFSLHFKGTQPGTQCFQRYRNLMISLSRGKRSKGTVMPNSTFASSKA